MLAQAILIETARKVGTCVLGLGVLWQVAEHAGWADGEVVVHVAGSDVDVLIDGSTYPVDPAPGAPIVCSLRPGSHTLSMTREGRPVYDETFTVEPGGNVVLTAEDRTRPRPIASQRRRPPSGRWRTPTDPASNSLAPGQILGASGKMSSKQVGGF